MDISDKKVAVLVHNYFEQAEFEEPISALKDAGAKVTVVSADNYELRGMEHAKMGDKFMADLLLNDADPYDYDALVLPGGVINADSLRTNLKAQEFVLEMLDSGMPVAVICHSPWILVSAEAVDGRRLTSYYTIKDDILNAGGEWVDLPVVVDDNLITSRKPDDLPYFNDQLISMLSQEEAETDTVQGTSKKYRIRPRDQSSMPSDLSQTFETLRKENLRDERAYNQSSLLSGEEED